MALASLLNLPGNARGAEAFAFDHDQLHRSMIATLDPSVGGPAIIDPAPIRLTGPRASIWHIDHQNGHDEFNTAIFGYKTQQNMADATFADKSSLSWWTFVNHQDHYRIDQIP